MSFAQECLDLHNKYRALHNAPPLKLDDKLINKAEELAQILLKGGVMLEKLYRPTYNINEFYLNLRSKTAVLQAETVIETWYKTRTRHQFKSNDPIRIPARFFTQMVWKGTTHMGIARITAEDGKWWAVGVYYPPGNVGGHYLENVEDVKVEPPPPPPPKEPAPIRPMTPKQKARYDKAVAEYEAKKKRLEDAKKDSAFTKTTNVLCCKPLPKKKKIIYY